jgi:hypothetical protein
MLEHHPPHVRKRAVLLITGGVGVVLIAILIIIYTQRTPETGTESGVSFDDFYATISDSAQSFFNGTRAIINKQ